MPPGGLGQSIAPDSFLRRVDPRTKIALSLAASAAVGIPLPPLAFFGACFVGLLAGAGLARQAAAQLWRARLWFAVLFLLDWTFVGVDFAVLITLRLALLAAAFILVFATTTPDELRVAGERLGLPPRLAFAFATAFRSLALLEREWQGILEAQKARDIVGMQSLEKPHWWLRRDDFTSAAALVVPAIVLAAQRAWSISEAAAARGFESPLRRSYRTLRLGALDHVLLVATVVVLGGSILLR